MKAMVLAAGVGSRLAPFTDTTPKCLIDVGGSPMIAHVFKRLRDVGVTSVVVNVHHFADQVISYLNSSHHELTVTISREAELLDTGGGIKFARRHLESEKWFLVHNADVASELDLHAIVNPVRESGAIAGISVLARKSSRHLLFDHAMNLVGRRTNDIDELIRDVHAPAAFAFSGVSCLSKRVFSLMDSMPSTFGLADFFLAAARSGERVVGVDGGTSFWLDMGTPQKLEALRSHLTKR